MRDDDTPPLIPPTYTCNSDPEEARLEAKEYPRYILAKSFFDCREYERCASVFLPSGPDRGSLDGVLLNDALRTPTRLSKGKTKVGGTNPQKSAALSAKELPHLSQKSLFLALYAKYLSGEKKKDEESEMILGPSDSGSAVNKELVGLTRTLEAWFSDRVAQGLQDQNQGWLEYLFGIILAKGKVDEDAKRWLVQSVRLCPFNWGAWLELNDILNNFEDVSGLMTERTVD